jgi:hypothetical protein
MLLNVSRIHRPMWPLATPSPRATSAVNETPAGIEPAGLAGELPPPASILSENAPGLKNLISTR